CLLRLRVGFCLVHVRVSFRVTWIVRLKSKDCLSLRPLRASRARHRGGTRSDPGGNVALEPSDCRSAETAALRKLTCLFAPPYRGTAEAGYCLDLMPAEDCVLHEAPRTSRKLQGHPEVL